MKKFVITAAIFAAAAFGVAAPASAQEGFYASGGYTKFDFDAGPNLGAVTGRLGYRFHPNFAVEGEGSVGIEDDNDVELNHNVGIYGVGILPVTESVDLFARGGWQQSDIEGNGIFPDVETDGAGYGAGVQWNLSPSFGLRGEYTKLDGDAEADAVSVSGVLRF